jgi:hypothetical protein
MTKIYDIGKAKADEYEKLAKRKAELEQLTHCCLVTTNSIINIVDIKRMEFSNIIEAYRKDWQYELDRINLKLGKTNTPKK